LDGRSALRMAATYTQNKRTQTTSMLSVEFEPTIPALATAKTLHALYRAATVIGTRGVSSDEKFRVRTCKLSCKCSKGKMYKGRSQWPRGLRQKLSSPSQTLGSWVRIRLETCMSVCVHSVFVLSCVQPETLLRAEFPSQESCRQCVG
jgi:hypothetical protein